MTTARAAAPNLGGRANTRSRAAVAISMTAARRPLGEIPRLHGEIPRRHRGVRVVALSIAAIQTAIQPVRRHFPSVIGIAASNSPAGGGANNSGSRCTAHTSHRPCAAKPGGCESAACSGDTGNQFNADRLTFVGLKNETDPDCHLPPDRRPCGLAHQVIQGFAAQPGGRRLISPAFRSEIRCGGSVRLSGDSFRCTYSRMKSLQNVADAGSIPAASTTTGVHGFDGTRSVDGRLAMVPAVSGSAESGVRCDGPNSQTPMTAFIGLRRQPDVPAARNGTKGRHLFNAAAAGKVDPRTKTVKTPGPRAAHYLESKYGDLPFLIVWGARRVR